MAGPRPLSELIEGLDARLVGDADPAIRSIEYDSRRVVDGSLFVAIPGHLFDGYDFADQAVERGAAAIVTERSSGPAPVPCVSVANARAALAAIACSWFDDPSRRLPVVGVTGTNGKTTVTSLLEALLATTGSVGRWSTTRVNVGDRSFATPRTTPEAPELQSALAEMVDAGCVAAVIEVSSHALRLRRVDGTHFAAAVFTNLSPDHLDFHADMNDYLDAKALLFEGLAARSTAVINLGDPAGRALTERTTGTVRTYGWADASPSADLRIEAFDSRPGGSTLTLRSDQVELRLQTPLFGRANAENLAAAIATALELGVDPDAMAEVVAVHRGEPGRLEPVQCGQSFAVHVDFAHTPGALQAALEAARSMVPGRLIVVFGCGGDRDRAKRPEMGRIASELADVVLVTSDNPRGEDPDEIIEAIVAGVPGDRRARVHTESDRSRAIERAIDGAGDDDGVLIAGKGHETEQVFADRTVPFDDREVASTMIRARQRREEAIST